MLRILLALLCLTCTTPAFAWQGEWRISLVNALELPGLDSQSPTDFDLATFAAGGEFAYGIFDWLDLGGRLVHSQVNDAVITDYKTQSTDDMPLEGDLFVDVSIWRCEAVLTTRLWGGHAVEPRLTVGAGYTWTIYSNPALNIEEGTVSVDDDNFAQGSLTATAGLNFAWRIFPFVELGAGVELTHFVDGLYTSSFRLPITLTGVFWGPI